ncbi:Protein disabled [Nymphon striatum]|nr:Protein disabled [Nymphon striatum]
MAEDNAGVPSEANETQGEENKENTPKDTRKDIPKESKLASLAKRSRPFNAKKEKDKVDPVAKFQEGVFFKAKIIGVEDVPDARGDRMCQVSLQRLKKCTVSVNLGNRVDAEFVTCCHAVMKNTGEHKTKVTVCVSIEGLKVREEKTADLLYHHPVHRISFIAQDMTDNRAFGYIFGAPDMGHKFYALKTEKTASLLVIAMRDLFQVVYDMKKQEIELAKEHRRTLTEQELIAQLPQGESSPESPEAQSPVQVEDSTEVVNDLLDLESELDNLRKGLSQIDTTISAAEIKKSQEELDKLVANPFGDSFVALPAATTQQTDFQASRPAQTSGSSPVPATLMPPPSSKKAPHKSTEELQNLFDAPITPNPELQSSFNPFHVPGTFPPNPSNQAFGNLPPSNQAFGNPSPANQAFGSPSPANQAFGNPSPTNQAFGNPSPANQAFGNPPPANQAFGSPSPANQAFGNLSPANQAFGNPFPANQAFGNPFPANQAFGNPSPANQAFGNPSPANLAFGNPSPANQTFGNPSPANQAFGNLPPANQAFGNLPPANQAFGTPFPASQPFGNTAPSEPAASAFDTPHFDAFNTGSDIDSTILSPERTLSVEESQPVELGPVDVLAALDPLGNNKPFVNRQQFFKELKPQKKSLRDLNPGSSNVSMTLSRNPFDVDVESGVQSEDVFCVSSPPLPPRLSSNVNLSTSPGHPAPKSKNPDNWVNFDTSPPEVPPPPLPAAPPPNESVPPTPPPRPPTTVVYPPALTPPLPKKEKMIGHSPNPFISGIQEPRTSSDGGYDSYDDVFEAPGTSPSSTSSPPTSPPIPIPSRRPHMSNLRHSPLIYDHTHSTSAITKSSVGHFVQPTSHSFPASKISNVDSMISSNVPKNTPEYVSVDSSSPCTSSTHSSPEPLRKQLSNNTVGDVCEQSTLSTSPNVNVSSISATPPPAEKETNDTVDRYAAIEFLDKGEFSSIFDDSNQDSQSADKADDEECASNNNEVTVPEFDESLSFQQISDPFDTDSITHNIYKNNVDAEALFKASFPENPVESDNFELEIPAYTHVFRTSFADEHIESHNQVFKTSFSDDPVESQTQKTDLQAVFKVSFADECTESHHISAKDTHTNMDAFNATFPEDPIESQMDAKDLQDNIDVFKATFPDDPTESQINPKDLHANVDVFKATFPDDPVECQSREKDVNVCSPMFKASFPDEPIESQTGLKDVKLNGDRNSDRLSSKTLEFNSNYKNDSDMKTVLSPVSYLNSKDIFHRESDPFDDDFFQESESTDKKQEETQIITLTKRMIAAGRPKSTNIDASIEPSSDLIHHAEDSYSGDVRGHHPQIPNSTSHKGVHLGTDKLVVFVTLLMMVLCLVSSDKMGKMGKSIVYDIKTPKVFYCPQDKPKDWNDVLVKSRPLDKLCEYEGGEIPKDHKQDCYDDLDETVYACAEKKRIMTRLTPAEEIYPNPRDTASKHSTEL